MKYAPHRILNLRVAPDVRPRLEALRARRPDAPTRHALAVVALRRGLEILEGEGSAEPLDAA